MKARDILGIIAAVLAILLLLAGYWGYTLSNEKKTLVGENESLTTELSDMRQLRDDLKTEVDSLQSAYNLLSEENVNLQTNVEEANKRAARLNSTIKKVKASNKVALQNSEEEKNSLRGQIQNLLNSKSQLEGRIQSLQSENDSLRNATGMLTADLSKAREENKGLSNLNQTMQNQLKDLTLANFKASAFRVEVEKKKPKATAKSRRARRIRVSFDLTEVPEEYRGVRPLYLAITDEKGTPIKAENPIQAKVIVNGQSSDIIAVEKKELNIVDNQRLSFSHDLAERLKSGYYRVNLYTDIGLLGSNSFRLR